MKEKVGKPYLGSSMGCLRLDILEKELPTMKVVHGDRKVAQRFLSLDPLASDFVAWSPYNYVLGNPIMFIDPDGRSPVEGWVEETTDEGKKTLTYDESVNTVEEAEAAGHKNVSNVHESATVSANDGSYSYSLNEDGTVQDDSDGSSVETRTTTEGGTIINVANEPAVAWLNSDDPGASAKGGTIDFGPGKILKGYKYAKTIGKKYDVFEKVVKSKNLGGQARAVYTKIKNQAGKTVKAFKDAYKRDGRHYERANKYPTNGRSRKLD